MTAPVAIAAELQPLVRIGVLWCDIGRVLERDAALDDALAAAAAAARGGDSAGISAARALYRAIGLDPTRTRPSSESLLRRVRRGEGLPRINTLVDIANWCSLEFQLPYGLYDADRLAPPMSLKLGGPGDAFPGIRKDVVHLDGRFALFDAAGPFGNPTSDSARTMVTMATRRVVAVVFGPAATSPARMDGILAATAARYRDYADGRETARWVH